MQLVPAGDDATLIELGEVTAEELHACAAAMRAEPGVVACIVGHSSLYVIGADLDCGDPSRRSHWVSLLAKERESGDSGRRSPDPRMLTFPVVFDGPDLGDLLRQAPDFLQRIASVRLKARYLGFRAGFAYLDGWPVEWAMPRRPTSRPVKRGAFAIAGNVAGFYPIDTPGGWNVLGHTNASLEHAIQPGDVITIEPVEELAMIEQRRRSERLHLRSADILAAHLTIEVKAKDWSKIPPGGPFDDVAAMLVQKAVRDCEVVLESAMVGPRLHFREPAFAAWCGPDLEVQIREMRAGEELNVGRISGGLRGYLAIGREAGVMATLERGDRHVIHAMAGPHDVGLREVECEVTPKLDRVGVRLRPLRELGVQSPGDLKSIGMQCGTVQLHPDGSLVAMGPDHPVTGGYLQPMTVISSERWKLAQLVPGERVTLRAQEPNW